MSIFYVYALKSLNYSRIYVGFTMDIDKRIKEHNYGKTKSTSHYRPWTLLYWEKFNSRSSARIKEKELKSGFGKEKLKRILLSAPVAHMDRAAVS